MKNKKTIGPVIAFTLLVLVAVVSVTAFNQWFDQYFSTLTLTQENESSKVSSSGILNVIDDKLYFRNNEDNPIMINQIKIEGTVCNVTARNITSGSIAAINLQNCTSSLASVTKDVLVISPDRVFSKKIYFKEAGVTSAGESILSTSLSSSFLGATTCSVGTRLYGLWNLTNSHVDNSTQTTGGYSMCLSDSSDSVTIGTSCSGTYATLFYIGNSSNSHIWIDNSSAYNSGSYTWERVCVSSDTGSIDVQYTSSDLSGSDYACLGSYLQNDTYGGVIGNCSSYSSKIWLKIS